MMWETCQKQDSRNRRLNTHEKPRQKKLAHKTVGELTYGLECISKPKGDAESLARSVQEDITKYVGGGRAVGWFLFLFAGNVLAEQPHEQGDNADHDYQVVHPVCR